MLRAMDVDAVSVPLRDGDKRLELLIIVIETSAR
jgi:hypothetical protein